MPTAAIYTRVSSKDQASKGFSLDAQEKIGRELCARNKWAFKVFIESGQSASKETLDNRPVLQEILDLVEDGCFQYVFTTELDRLSRHPVTLYYIKKILSDNDVKVVTPSQTFDFRDDEDGFLSGLLGLLAERENSLRVKRSKRAKNEAVTHGRWVGSTLPYGWMKQPCAGDRLNHNKLVPHPDESKVVLSMMEWSLSGMGLIGIALKLNALGIPTKNTGGANRFIWKAGTVHEILSNPVHKGDYVFNGIVTKIPGIVLPRRWQLVIDNLKKNFSAAGRNTKNFYLLRGLLVCKRCGRNLWAKIKPSTGERCYYCASKQPNPHPRSCGLRNMPLDAINNYAWELTRGIVQNSDVIKNAINEQRHKNTVPVGDIENDIKSIDARIAKIDGQSEMLLDLYTRGNYPAEGLEKKTAEFKDQKNALKTERAALAGKINEAEQGKNGLEYLDQYLKTVRGKIDGFNDQERFDLLHALVNRIIVDYDSKTNSHLLEFEYIIPVNSYDKKSSHVVSLRRTLQLYNRRMYLPIDVR